MSCLLLCITCHIKTNLEMEQTCCIPRWGLGNLDTRFFDLYLAEHELVVPSLDHPQDETWILFDSGAAANCCPPDFAPEFPLLRLDERVPPLKSISGQTLNIYGRKLVALASFCGRMFMFVMFLTVLFWLRDFCSRVVRRL